MTSKKSPSDAAKPDYDAKATAQDYVNARREEWRYALRPDRRDPFPCGIPYDAFLAGVAWQREQYERQREELRALCKRGSCFRISAQDLHGEFVMTAAIEKILGFDTPAKGER